MATPNTYSETLNNVYGTSRSAFLAKVTDQVYNTPSTLNDIVLRSGGVKKEKGRRLEWNVRLGRYTTTAWRAYDTSDPLVTENPNTTLTASDDWGTINLAMDVTDDFMRLCKGNPNLLYNGVEEKVDAGIDELLDRINRALLASSTTTNAVQSLIAATPASISGTWQNISTTTYTDWATQTNTTGGSFASVGLNQIRSMILTLSRGQDVDEPDLALCDNTVFGYVWQLNDTRDMIILEQEQTGRRLARAMMIGNLKMRWDKRYPNSTTMRFFNSKYFDIAIQSESNKDGVSMGEWIHPNNATKSTSILEWQAQIRWKSLKFGGGQVSGWTA